MSNPANRLPPEYDETLPQDYDPEFTASISTHMRVPDKIGADGEGEDTYDAGEYYRRTAAFQEEKERVAAMNVPDKIMVAGADRDAHMNLDLHLDHLPTSQGYVGLETPPRVLTLEDRPFPPYRDSSMHADYTHEPRCDDEEDEILQVRGHKVYQQNGYITPHKQPNAVPDFDMLQATPGEGLLIPQDDDDDLTQLRRQVAKLTRHVQRLEDENSKRSTREFLLYPILAGYFLMKMAKFFMGRN